MTEAVIVDAVRTPFGKHDGSFRDTHPQDLAAAPLKALQDRNGFDPSTIEDVMYGCVKPVFEQGSNIGRIAPLVAGWGDDVPGFQLDRMCGSGQQTVNLAAANVRADFHDIVVAGCVEHITRIPMTSNRSGKTAEPDTTDTYFQHYDEMVHQGESAERVAEKWGFDRRELDEIAGRIADGPTKALGRIARMFDETYARQLPDQLAVETEQMASTAKTDDYLEDVRVFADKRDPEFTGR